MDPENPLVSMAVKAKGAMPGVALVAVELPPGYRFQPTDEELLTDYLKPKNNGGLNLQHAFIPEIDLYNLEPWELPDKCFSPSRGHGPKEEWYLFGPRCRKYASNRGRYHRMTRAGYWKSTCKDRPVIHQGAVIGYKKTLVFRLGRAPNGESTDWTMHEYRLHSEDTTASMQSTYALCRLMKKKAMNPPPDVRSVVVAADKVPSVTDANKGNASTQSLPNLAVTDDEQLNIVAAADKVQFLPSVDRADEVQFVPSAVSPDHEQINLDQDGIFADLDMDVRSVVTAADKVQFLPSVDE